MSNIRQFKTNIILTLAITAILIFAVIGSAILPCVSYAEGDTVCVSVNSYGKISVFDKNVGDKFVPDIPQVPAGYYFAGWSDGKNTYESDEEIEITLQYAEKGLTLTAIYLPLEKDYTLYYIIGGACGGLLLIILILLVIILKKKRAVKK